MSRLRSTWQTAEIIGTCVPEFGFGSLSRWELRFAFFASSLLRELRTLKFGNDMRAMCASTDLLVTTTAIRQPIIHRLSAKQSQSCCAHRMRAVSRFVFFYALSSPYRI